MTDIILVITTVPDKETGCRIARTLVEERLAACATLSADSFSFYWWEGSIREERERILLIKTRRDLSDDLEKRVREIHPYSVPEIIAISIENGYPPYLNWVKAETRPKSG
jgi:periplasmic divalent cation tolerance protein